MPRSTLGFLLVLLGVTLSPHASSLPPVGLTERAFALPEITTNSDAGSSIRAKAELGCVAAPPGLAGWWRAEGNAQDSVNGLASAISGSMSFIPGWVGQSFHPGADGLVRVANHPNLRPANITISLWARSSEPSSGRYILSKGLTPSWHSYGFKAENGRVQFYIPSGNIFPPTASSPSAIFNGPWRHVVGTYDGSSLRLYVNAVLVSSVAWTGGISYGPDFHSGDVFIGGFAPGYPDQQWLGDIDEVLIFGRALSDSEIAAIYNAGAAGVCPPPEITQAPASRAVFEGATVQLEVDAASNLPLSYQWRFNDSDIPGANEPMLNIGPVTASHAGKYTVVVSDANGSANSTAYLSVNTCATGPAGLAGFWRGEADGTDSAGGLDGAVSGSMTFTPGWVGQAFRPGADGLVRVPNHPNLSPATITVSLWARSSGLSEGRSLLGKSYSPSWHSYGFLSTGAGVQFYVPSNDRFPPRAASRDVVWNGAWRHLVGVYDGSAVRLYIDGVQISSVPWTAGIYYGSDLQSGDLFIGGFAPASPDNQWLGEIDEVMIFGRPLSEVEIATIYHAGAAGLCAGPKIVTQPRSQSVRAGAPVRFTVEVLPGGAFTYQWQFNGEDIPGQTGPALEFEAGPEHAGRYLVIVGNEEGTISSAEAVLEVDECVPPPPGLVAWWPGDGVFLNLAGATRGGLRAGASFGPGPVGGAFLFDGTDDHVLLGADSGNFGTANFTMAFWIRHIGNRRETVLSRISADIGANNIKIEVQSSGRVLYRFERLGDGGGTVNLETAAGIDNNWHHYALVRSQSDVVAYIDGVPAASALAEPFNVDSPATLLVGGEPPGGLGAADSFTGALDEIMFFQAALSAAEIRSIFESSVAGVCLFPTRPAVGRPTGGGSALSGASRTLAAVADGLGPFTYQWWHNGAILAGATASTYSIPSVSVENAGDYFVVVRSPYGYRVSEAIGIEIALPPTITQQPSSQAVRIGANESIRLGVRYSGTGPFAFQWTRNDEEIPTATNPFLEISSPAVEDSGLYRVRVSNAAGSATSDPATVAVLPQLQVTAPPASTQTGEGQRVELNVQLAGAGPFRFQWRLNGRNIPGANSATYVIDAMRLQDAGEYTVTISNVGGAVTAGPALVTLVSIPQTQASDNFATAVEISGESGRIRATNADATREPFEPQHARRPGQHSIWFAWVAPANGRLGVATAGSSFDTLLAIYRGTALGQLDSVAIGNDEGGFSTSVALASVHVGVRYHIAIDGLGDGSGNVIFAWRFEPNAPVAPRIRRQPESVATRLGAEIQLNILADDVQAYQWRLNGSPIPNATGPELVLPSLSRNQLGTYDVILSGGAVQVPSQPAAVQVGTDTEVLAFDKLFDRLNSIDGNQPAPAPRIGLARSIRSVVAASFGSAPAARGFVGVPGTHETSTVGASRDPGEPNHAGEAGGASTWFVIVPDATGTMEVTTDGSDFDTVLAVYSGPPTVLSFSQLQLVTSDNNSGANGLTSRVAIPVTAGSHYYCAVDGVDGAQGLALINYIVGLPPVIQESPAAQSVLTHGRVTFRARAANAANTDYQWHLNDAPVVGGTGAELMIADAQATHAGQYTCVVSTFAGSATSSPALLTVLPAQPLLVSDPLISGNGISLRIEGGSPLPLRAQASSNLQNWSEIPIQIFPDGTAQITVPKGSAVQFIRIVQ